MGGLLWFGFVSHFTRGEIIVCTTTHSNYSPFLGQSLGVKITREFFFLLIFFLFSPMILNGYPLGTSSVSWYIIFKKLDGHYEN